MRRYIGSDGLPRSLCQACERSAEQTRTQVTQLVIFELLDFERQAQRLGQRDDLIIVSDVRTKQRPYARCGVFSGLGQSCPCGISAFTAATASSTVSPTRLATGSATVPTSLRL